MEMIMDTKMDSNILLIAVLTLSVGLFGVWYWKTDTSDVKVDPNSNQWNQHGWNLNNSKEPVEPQIKPPINDNQNNQPIKYKNYQEAVLAAKAQNKKMFIFFHEDWCHWCEKMQKETLSNPKVKNALQKYIVYVTKKSKEEAVARKYKVRGIPAYYIASYRERIEKRGIGFKDADSFLNWLNGQSNNNRRPDNNRRMPG